MVIGKVVILTLTILKVSPTDKPVWWLFISHLYFPLSKCVLLSTAPKYKNSKQNGRMKGQAKKNTEGGN